MFNKIGNQVQRAGLLLLGLTLMSPVAHAVPSFARQTGMACEACHTVFPELTHFGRMFKANGYTLDNLKQVRDIDAAKQEMLSLSSLPPLAAMIQVSETWLNSPLPDGTGAPAHSQTSTVGFPQQLSLFYAGKVAPHVGAMVQLTYANDSGTIGIDNTDIRYANNFIFDHTNALIYGISINNNPTVQDLWNSTPAWGFPYASSNATVSPLAGTQIDGALAQDVAGISIYAMWNEALYVEAGAYRSAKQGVTNPLTGAAGPLDGTVSNVISGAAPYGRLAYEYQRGRHDLELGMYGAAFKLYPGGGAVGTPASLGGPVNQFRDLAEDLQYQYIGDQHLFSINGTRIHETMNLAASFAAGATANPNNDLTTVRFTGTYYYRRKYGASISHFSTTGSSDSGLYPAGPTPGVITSASGSPDTRGWILEANYLPWLNTKITLQYITYSEFNGGSTDYDGFGRSASANGSTYLLVWLNF
ncbi:MAG: hypothetical protein WB646_13415 [Steroidobacteraceae bacterium]